MTPEDKNWLYIGCGLLAVAGGIYYYKNKDTSDTKNLTEANKGDNDVTDAPATATPKYFPENGTGGNKTPNNTSNSGSSTQAPPTPSVNNEPKPSFILGIGQMVMCANPDQKPVKVFDVQRGADKTFFSKMVEVGTYNYGDELGTIEGIIKYKGGHLKYVIKSTTRRRFGRSQDSSYFLINAIRVKAFGKILPSKSLSDVPTLNVNLVLKRGSNGLEVKALQKKLGLPEVDQIGTFGPKTEAALLKIKGVKQIALSGF